MYIANITDDYNDTISINNNCTNSENNIEMIIPLVTKIPCGLSLICLISLMINTLIKPLFDKKENFVKYKWRKFYTQKIQLGVS